MYLHLTLYGIRLMLGFSILSAIAACGYTLVFFYENALSWPIIIGAGLIGCGEIGLVGMAGVCFHSIYLYICTCVWGVLIIYFSD